MNSVTVNVFRTTHTHVHSHTHTHTHTQRHIYVHKLTMEIYNWILLFFIWNWQLCNCLFYLCVFYLYTYQYLYTCADARFMGGGGGGGGSTLWRGHQAIIFLFFWFTQLTCLIYIERGKERECLGSIPSAVFFFSSSSLLSLFLFTVVLVDWLVNLLLQVFCFLLVFFF